MKLDAWLSNYLSKKALRLKLLKYLVPKHARIKIEFRLKQQYLNQAHNQARNELIEVAMRIQLMYQQNGVEVWGQIIV